MVLVGLVLFLVMLIEWVFLGCGIRGDGYNNKLGKKSVFIEIEEIGVGIVFIFRIYCSE